MNSDLPQHQDNPKRQAILICAEAAFLHNGYAGASMDNIALSAEVSKATIYSFFKSKSVLFESVVLHLCNRASLNNTTLSSEGQTALVPLTLAGQTILSFITSPNFLSLYRVMANEAATFPELRAIFWQTWMKCIPLRLSQLFDELCDKGLLEIDNTKTAAFNFMGLLMGDFFYCRTLGLPEGTEIISFDQTVDSAVQIMQKAHTIL